MSKEEGAKRNKSSQKPAAGVKKTSITAARILELRTSGGLTQADVIARLSELGSSMNASTLSKIENGHRSITDIDLLLFAKVFGVNVEELFR